MLFSNFKTPFVWVGVDLVSIAAVLLCTFCVMYWTRHSGHIEIHTNGLRIGRRHPLWPMMRVQDVSWSEFRRVFVTDGGLTIVGLRSVLIPGLDDKARTWVADWISASKQRHVPIEDTTNPSKSIPKELQALRNEQYKGV